MEINPPTETFGMGGINNSVSICTSLAIFWIFKEVVVGRKKKKRQRVAWGVGAVGSDSLMFFAGEHVLNDWLWDELAVTWRRGSKCTNDCEQSGHSNHEYWICKGAHLQRATPTPPPLPVSCWAGAAAHWTELTYRTHGGTCCHEGGVKREERRKLWLCEETTRVGILKLWWIPRYITSNHQIRQQRCWSINNRAFFFFFFWLINIIAIITFNQLCSRRPPAPLKLPARREHRVVLCCKIQQSGH